MVRPGRLGAPATYGDAFRRLGGAGLLDQALAARLVHAVGFRNLLVHSDLALARGHAVATDGPADLRSFPAALATQNGQGR